MRRWHALNDRHDREELIIEELARIGFANINEVLDLETGTIKPGISYDTAAAIASIAYKQLKEQEDKQADVRFYDKLKALELLAKHYSMFGEKKAPEEPVTLHFSDDYGDGDASDPVE